MLHHEFDRLMQAHHSDYADALTWAQDGSKVRTETIDDSKGSSRDCRWNGVCGSIALLGREGHGDRHVGGCESIIFLGSGGVVRVFGIALIGPGGLLEAVIRTVVGRASLGRGW